jgi:hypothetical protein
MAVDYRPGWDGHDARRKCGLITAAHVADGQVQVSGYLYSRDFPEVEAELERSAEASMGMSYELADAHVEDIRAEVWTLTRATFTGAAILRREKAAYQNTAFRLQRRTPRVRRAGGHAAAGGLAANRRQERR